MRFFIRYGSSFYYYFLQIILGQEGQVLSSQIEEYQKKSGAPLS